MVGISNVLGWGASNASPLGAQTERPGVDWPVRALLRR